MSPSLAERFGLALQQQRQAHRLSQSQLAELANVSLKHVGDIERGDANARMSTLERLTDALEWDPFEVPLREQDTLPEGVRTLLLAELNHMRHLVEAAIGWLQTLDAAMVRRASQPQPAQVRPVGRPRKSKEPTNPPRDHATDAERSSL